MEFISFPFAVILIVSFFFYYGMKRNGGQKAVLLLASMAFIGYYHLMYLVVSILVALFTYGVGLLLADRRGTKGAAYLLAASIIVLAGTWLMFRCYLQRFPLGMSFYTFQALSYLIEVYWEDEEPEKNVVDFTLYMLLFMKFLSGPIERGYDLLPQLKKSHAFDYCAITGGMKLLLLGVMMKLLIADRIAPYLDNIFGSVRDASGIQLLEATLLYPIQLYTDFAGYTNMAIGIGMMFGFKLSPNFNRPFVSLTTGELWRRWHMSLSFWVRDYIFVPLTATFRGWNKWGIYFSLIVTFVSLGIWHGAGWTFAIYGLIQGVIIIYETAMKQQREKVKQRIGERVFNTLSIVRTYILFALSLLFFRVDGLTNVGYTLSHLTDGVRHSFKEANLGMADHDWIVFGIATVLYFIYEYFNERHDLIKGLERRSFTLRWCVYYVCLILLFMYGAFGVENFIYIQF